MKYNFHIGVDVSKTKLDFAVVDRLLVKLIKHFVIPNTKEGILDLLETLTESGITNGEVLVCLENTGVYSRHLCSVLANEKIDHWIADGLEIKLSKGIVRTKNDRVDALEIAMYSIRNIDKLKLYSAPHTEIIKLKLLFAEREKATKALLLFKSTNENLLFFSEDTFRTVASLNLKIVNEIKAHCKSVESHMLEIVNRNELLDKQYKLITSVTGIGKITALYFIITTNAFNYFANWRKYACYAGVAPFEYRSGTSVLKNPKVHKFGNKKMKAMLRMCAMTAITRDAQIKVYYKKKMSEGKHSRLVLNNIKCKLIARVFAVVKRKTLFVNIHGFANS